MMLVATRIVYRWSPKRFGFPGMDEPPFTLIEAEAIHQAFSEAMADAKEREGRMLRQPPRSGSG